MSRPWMPLYVADYLRDTRHLTAAEHGAYLLLIMQYWTFGSLPNDDARLARIASMTEAEWLDSRSVIAELFEPGWRHKRIDEELAKSAEKYERRSEAGKRGAAAKHSAGNAEAKDQQCHPAEHGNALASSSQPQPQIPEANASGAAPVDPSIAERDFFRRGREVLGKNAGGQLAKLKASRGHNVSLARAAIETAATKQNPAEYIAAIIRGPPVARAATVHQQRQVEGREVLDELNQFNARAGGREDSRVLRHDSGDGPESIRGGPRGNLIELSPGGNRSFG